MLGRRPPLPAISDFTTFDLEALAATPTKKDPSAPNGSSIAILAEYNGHAVLLTGDAYADVLVESIRQLQRERGAEGRKLKLDAVKLSHHGSAHGTTTGLLDQIECPRYLVSSNGDIFGHPDREAIARVIVHGGERPTLCFNYRSALNAIWDERALRDRYRYDAVYPKAGQEGIRVQIAD
jgi:beta-lactamase superfamily II metal-dependent hydrolase